MPIKGVEQLDIERINSYEDNRFSEKVLRQHGAFVVNGIFFYEVLITGTSEAVITGENRKYYEAVSISVSLQSISRHSGMYRETW